MKFRTALITISGAALFAFTGCSNKLLFVTHSSLGLDVSGTTQVPDHVSLTYHRQEFAHVPEKEDGSAHSVYGGLDSDIGFFSGAIIRQTFATGDAAAAAAAKDEMEDSKVAGLIAQREAEGGCPQEKRKPLLFSTASTYGLHISFGEAQLKPSLLMGFRRVEAAYVPISDPAKEVRPLYASLLINSKPHTIGTNAPAWKVTTNFPTGDYSVRIRQSFGTGRAALILAGTDSVIRAQLREAASGGSPSMAETAATEAEIEKRAKALSQDKQIELFQWADKSFPKESQGKLAKAKSISKFVSSLLPMLDADGLQAVRIKIEQLEK